MTSDTWSPEFSAAGGRGGRHSWLTPSSGALLRAAASLLLRAGAGGRGGGQAGGRHWCPEVPEIHGFLGTLFPADLRASYKIKSQGGRQSQAWEASATCPRQRSQSRGPLLSLPDRSGASRPRGIKYHLFCILAKSVSPWLCPWGRGQSPPPRPGCWEDQGEEEHEARAGLGAACG